MYVKGSSEHDQIIVCIYMDDLLIIESNETEVTKFMTNMKNKFEMSNLGNLAYFLGMEFSRTKRNMKKLS